MTEESDVKEAKLKKTPMFKIHMNLRAFPFAEEMMHECEDGEVREGIFIPYEVDGVRFIYRGDKQTVINLMALANNRKRRRMPGCRPNTTHTIHPYWTKAQKAKMEQYGFEQKTTFLGSMLILRWSGWVTGKDY